MKRKIEKLVLQILERILPATLFDRLLISWRRRVNKIRDYYPQAFFLSKKKSNKKYCVVRYALPEYGIMAAGVQYIFYYYKLLDRGYIPIMDLEYAYSYRQGRIGEHGMWDLCFEQTITAQQAIHENYVLVTGKLFECLPDKRMAEWLNGDGDDHFLHTRKDDFREYYAKAKKLVEPIWQIKKSILEELDDEIGNELREHRVMGVFLRENFSREINHRNQADIDVFARHPLLPTVAETINLIKNNLKHWNFDKIYLSTIYEDSIMYFRKEFGDKVIAISRERFDINQKQTFSFSNTEQDMYQEYCNDIQKKNNLTVAYVKDLVALSKCTYFMGGPSSGSAAALTMNGGKYEDIYILEDRRKIMRY